MSILTTLADDVRQELIHEWGQDCISWISAHVQREDLLTEIDSTIITEESFSKWLGLPGNPLNLCKRLWSACSSKGPQVTTIDVIRFCAVLTKGTCSQRAALAFDMCDTSRTGLLTRKDLISTAQALEEARISTSGELRQTEHSIESEVDTFIKQVFFDHGVQTDLGDISISRAQWLEAFCSAGLDQWRDFLYRIGRTSSLHRLPKPMIRTSSDYQHLFGPKFRVALHLMLAVEAATSQNSKRPSYAECLEQFQGEAGKNASNVSMVGGISLSLEDFQYTMSIDMYGNNCITHHGRRHISKAFQVDAYAPKVFQGLRALEGLTDESFLSSVGADQFYCNLLLGEPLALNHFDTPAKSGSSFFVTPDKKLLVKTIRECERVQLLDMLQEYTHHLHRNPRSLITRYLGLYTVTLDNGGTELDIVLMRNLLAHVDISSCKRFDLKGCVNRDDLIHSGLLAESSWLEQKQSLGLPADITATVLDSLRDDVAWLASCNVMDYSLFVVFSLEPPLERISQGTLAWTQLPAFSGKCYVSLGVVDILTFYGFKKRMETRLKSTFSLGEDIVCISADEYRQRFLTFMAGKVCTVSEHGAGDDNKSSGKSLERPNSCTSFKRGPATNSNCISDYSWMRELLDMIVSGNAKLAVHDASVPETVGTPLFVVAGACPTRIFGMRIGMQAMMYSQMPGSVQFWWIKPQRENPNNLELETLNLHTSGKFKNLAERSKSSYAPLAEKFSNGEKDGEYCFGIDASGRAFIEETYSDKKSSRMLLYFVWQENWSSVGKAFVEGRLFYQKLVPSGSFTKEGDRMEFASRQYRISGSQLTIWDAATEEVVPSLFPSDYFPDLCDG